MADSVLVVGYPLTDAGLMRIVQQNKLLQLYDITVFGSNQVKEAEDSMKREPPDILVVHPNLADFRPKTDRSTHIVRKAEPFGNNVILTGRRPRHSSATGKR
ncbi:MAG TPA: hypothetical protein VHA30_00770 [Patescibacteria group bacterium]|nr:hypothetical protein [Patescibacteria group bacterium]